MRRRRDPEAESLFDVYRSLFGEPGDTHVRESASREGKTYALTHAMFEAKKRAIVKTVAAIANAGADIGYIVFKGKGEEDAPVDLAVVDDAIRATVAPRVAVEHAREVVDGLVVDFLRIPRNDDRPHLMLTPSNEMIVPFRGSANNITAARHEIDRMYEDRTVRLIQRALGASLTPAEDPVERFLAEEDWGGISQATDAEFVFAIVPQNQHAATFADMLESPNAHAILSNAWSRTIQQDENTDWFTLHGDFATARRDGYTEAYQPAREGHRIGTLLMYDIGAVIARMWILEPFIDGDQAYSNLHFVHALHATLRYTWRLYEQSGFPEGDLEIRCLLVNAQGMDLWLVPSGNPKRIARNRDVGRRLELPKRPARIPARELGTQARAIAERLGKTLRSHYED